MYSPSVTESEPLTVASNANVATLTSGEQSAYPHSPLRDVSNDSLAQNSERITKTGILFRTALGK